MLKNFLLLSTLVFLTFSGFAQEKYSLTIEVQNIKKMEGKISICIMNKEEQFLSDCFQGRNISIESKEFFAVFDGLPAGDYAVSLYQDEDENGKLNVGKLIPIPSEKYGFSNNPSTTFGPPDFEDCLFTLDDNKRIVIEL